MQEGFLLFVSACFFYFVHGRAGSTPGLILLPLKNAKMAADEPVPVPDGALDFNEHAKKAKRVGQ